jgi:hypothetical protein
MQNLVNIISLLSGLVSLGVFAGSTYLYFNKDVLVEQAREKITEEITDTITKSLPAIVDKSMPEIPKFPELPKETGPVIFGN